VSCVPDGMGLLAYRCTEWSPGCSIVSVLLLSIQIREQLGSSTFIPAGMV
jgi:hypothetical protein